MSASDKEQQHEEILVIESMFDSDSFVKKSNNSFDFFPSKAFTILNHLEDLNLKLTLTLPNNYPSCSQPLFSITEEYSPELPFTFLSSRIIDEIQTNFDSLFIPGEVVIYSWLSFLEEYLSKHAPTYEDLKRPNHEVLSSIETVPQNYIVEPLKSIKFPDKTFPCHPIFSGPPIEDRKSVFIAHVSRVESIEEVEKTLDFLLLDRKIAKAAHNISAYRIITKDNILIQDNDDDGETAAGSRLQHLIQVLDVKNVLVVVSRWYGGIQLGPDRFKHINNVARQALEDQGYLNTDAASSNSKKKTAIKKR